MACLLDSNSKHEWYSSKFSWWFNHDGNFTIHAIEVDPAQWDWKIILWEENSIQRWRVFGGIGILSIFFSREHLRKQKKTLTLLVGERATTVTLLQCWERLHAAIPNPKFKHDVLVPCRWDTCTSFFQKKYKEAENLWFPKFGIVCSRCRSMVFHDFVFFGGVVPSPPPFLVWWNSPKRTPAHSLVRKFKGSVRFCKGAPKVFTYPW